MLDSQRKILETRDSKYLNIGVTADGSSRNAIAVPWKHTGNAFNMRTPDVFLSAADLQDPAVMALLEKYIIHGCYIFDPLEDYSFINRFKSLWDVSIAKGYSITDISFMDGLNECFMFYIEDARIETLEPLFPAEPQKERFRSYCMGFCNCQINDISAFERENVRLSELVVIQPEGTNEKSRWKKVRAGTYSYYEYR